MTCALACRVLLVLGTRLDPEFVMKDEGRQSCGCDFIYISKRLDLFFNQVDYRS